MNNAAKVLWSADENRIKQSNLFHFIRWLQDERGLSFLDYHSLWEWSIQNTADFWESIWDYFQVESNTPYSQILSSDKMPYTKWFEGATLNYAAHIFRNKTEKYPAIIYSSERQPHSLSLSWKEFEDQTAALRTFLQKEGVQKGDRIAAYLPNIPEASVGLMATISLGAVWSSCSPDFGTESVLDRFSQISPKILLAADGYSYNGKPFDRKEILKQMVAALPSLEKVIFVPYLNRDAGCKDIPSAISWNEVMQMPHGELEFAPVPFSHPIWILFSSGTTGLPKAITHSHGGMLLEHLKYLSLHNDVHPGEKFFWFSTTGWMMWNFVQASLLVGATIVCMMVVPDIRIWKDCGI